MLRATRAKLAGSTEAGSGRSEVRNTVVKFPPSEDAVVFTGSKPAFLPTASNVGPLKL